MFVTGTYVGVDWAAFFHPFQSRFQGGAGYARDILCAIIVLIAGRNRIGTKDRRLLLVAFALTLVADYFLTIMNQPLPGTVIFLGVHSLLIARHAQGFRASLGAGLRGRTLRWLAATAVVAFGGAGVLIVVVSPILERTGQFTLDAIYLVFLSVSLWMGWGVLIRRFYPRLNAWFIAVGMTFFYACDVTVGLSVAEGSSRAGVILSDLIAFSYTPALLLLSLSVIAWARPAPGEVPVA
jgi:hypothetical protein